MEIEARSGINRCKNEREDRIARQSEKLAFLLNEAAEALGEVHFVVGCAPLGEAFSLVGGSAYIIDMEVAVGVEHGTGDRPQGEEAEGEHDQHRGCEDERNKGPEVPRNRIVRWPVG